MTKNELNATQSVDKTLFMMDMNLFIITPFAVIFKLVNQLWFEISFLQVFLFKSVMWITNLK